jgi:predicted  nucleic acid-binding Zn-ribbon protein
MSSDIELAIEIGQGLLSEVRRMQSILQERQDSLILLEHEKQENQHRTDDLIKQLRFKNETEERLKEDIWNLELTKQDLSHQIRQLSQTISKSPMDQVRRERQKNLVHQELELMKTAQIKWQDVINKTQSEYEAKLDTLNQSLGKLKREKEAIALQLEQLNDSIAQAKKKDNDLEKRKPSAEEIQALQLSLAQAHGMVEALKEDLEIEKQKKCEVDELLRESQETIEQMQKTSSSSATESEEQLAAVSWCQDTVRSSAVALASTVVIVDESSTVTATSSIHTLPRSLEEEMSHVNNHDFQESSIDRFGSMLMKESCSTNPSSASVTQQDDGEDEQVEHPVHPLALPLTRLNGFEKVLPFVMHTMIGEWLYKYTRYHIGNGISNKSHQRFFWLHPYTKTLYWSRKQPGVQGGEYKAKSGKPLIIASSINHCTHLYAFCSVYRILLCR